MALTKEQIEQYEKMASGERKSGVERYFRISIPDGKREYKHSVRILPTKPDLVTESKVHYLPTKVNATCPSQFKNEKGKPKPCLCCDTFFQNIQNFKGTPYWDTLKKLAPKHRKYYNVLDLESGLVLIWSLPSDGPNSYGNSLLKDIIERAKKGIDVTSPTTGRDLEITLKPQGAAFNYSGNWKKGKGTKLPASAKGWEEELHDLHDIQNQKVLSKEEMQAAVNWFKEKVGADE